MDSGTPTSTLPDDTIERAALSELRHNLRTPVNHILGYTEMLIEDAEEAQNAAALSAFREAHAMARGALAEINEALANRDSASHSEIERLAAKVRPRMERVEQSVERLREAGGAPAADWASDLARVAHAARSLMEMLGERACGPAAAPAYPERVARPRRDAAGARVLVVDDNEANRNVLTRRLERQGYSVEEAANGEAALELLAAEPFDLVLLDILMPVMDGFETLARMRADHRLRAVPVLVISAVDEVDSVVRAIEMGAEDYLFKPFDPVLLRARIGALLERKRLVNELAVQAKLASLGALTAGIAHEIRNPLNFVVNFAQLAEDAAREQARKLEEAGTPSASLIAEARELAQDVLEDLAKVREHAARADGIVAAMLAHSRGQPGERRPTDLNALVRDYVNLAFHGMRAQDSTFQTAIESDFDPEVGVVVVVPQDLSRVFLNVGSNACYAVRQKAGLGIAGYQPVIHVSTRNLGDRVEARIRDNGVGIPADALDRVFDPFFTTKNAGEGAGLGLSLSYDIVVQEHQGEISVDSREGEYTEFVIRIPRANRGV